MSVLVILVCASLFIAVGFLCAFIWSVKSNQYEDQEGSSIRMLHDDHYKY